MDNIISLNFHLYAFHCKVTLGLRKIIVRLGFPYLPNCLGPTPFILLTFLLKEAKFKTFSVKIKKFLPKNSKYLKNKNNKIFLPTDPYIFCEGTPILQLFFLGLRTLEA